MRLHPGKAGPPEKVALLNSPNGRLLADGKELLFVSPEMVAVLNDGQTAVLSRQVLGDCSRPFLYGGCPAVYEELPTGTSLLTFRDGQWSQVNEAPLPPATGQGGGISDLRVVAAGQDIHCFRRTQQAILHWSSADASPGTWKPAANTPDVRWAVIRLDGAPAIVYADGTAVVCKRLANGTWQQVFRQSVGMVVDLGACTTDRPGEVVVLQQGFPGSLQTSTVRNGQLASKSRNGGGFPFPFPFFPQMIRMILTINGITMLTPLLLAVLLNRSMLRFRTRGCSAGGREAPHATLVGRGCAQLIDGIILSGPSMAGWLMMLSGFEDFPSNPLTVLPAVLLTLGGLFWSLAGLLLFSWMEGAGGQSPGKRLLGIRVVGMEFEPIGFGRALVRNLLKVVDGMFGFAVGMMLVATTEKWQRLGDMAAHAMVISGQPRASGADAGQPGGI